MLSPGSPMSYVLTLNYWPRSAFDTDSRVYHPRAKSDAYIEQLEHAIGSPLLPAFRPVIQPGDTAWTALDANHLYGQVKNHPYTNNNGGLWPMLTELYTVGLTRYGCLQRVLHLITA